MPTTQNQYEQIKQKPGQKLTQREKISGKIQNKSLLKNPLIDGKLKSNRFRNIILLNERRFDVTAERKGAKMKNL